MSFPKTLTFVFKGSLQEPVDSSWFGKRITGASMNEHWVLRRFLTNGSTAVRIWTRGKSRCDDSLICNPRKSHWVKSSCEYTPWAEVSKLNLIIPKCFDLIHSVLYVYVELNVFLRCWFSTAVLVEIDMYDSHI